MSRFLGFESYLIPLGSTRTDVHTTIRSALTSRGWQIVHDSLLMPVKAVIGNWGANDTQRLNAIADRVGDDMSANAEYRNGTLDWIGLEFDTAVSVRTVKFYTSANGDYFPKDYSIEWSDDGTAWTSVFAETATPIIRSWQPFVHRLPDSGLHKFWRISCLNAYGSYRKQITAIEFLDQYGNIAVPPAKGYSYFHCIPPVTEQIGDVTARGILRFEFSNTEMRLRPIFQSKVDFTQTYLLADNADSSLGHNAGTHAGMNPAKITVTDLITKESVTVQQDPATLSSTNTARQNFRYLYSALKASTEPLIQKLDFQLNVGATQNAEVPEDNIIVTCKSTETLITMPGQASSTVGVYPMGFKSYSGDVNLQKIPPRAALPIDLVSGFIYYLQVNARGIALATKTNTAVSSPVHACYANHDKATAVKPLSAGKYCSAIELVVGFDEDANNIDSWCVPSHTWVISDRSLGYRFENWGNYYSDSHLEHNLSRTCIRYDIFDAVNGHFYGYDGSQNGYETRFQLLGSNIWTDNSLIGNDFQIHRLSNPRVWSSDWTNIHFATKLVPQLEIDDWFKFRGTAVNEALVLVADTQTLNTLTTDFKAADNITTLPLGRTDGFNQTGFVAIGDEIFQYTGISGNTLTGVSRARYGTVASDHYNGDTVYQCLWFTVMGGGALLCGYNKPS